jgi:ABC-2 type transport system ATP-binding protein
MAPEPAIRTENLRKEYNETVALDGLSLTVDQGSVYGFLGPNGAGKTTTMRILTCLLQPTSGEAWVAGHPIENRSSVTDRIGYLPEEPPVYDELTGREQLQFWAGVKGLDRDVAVERVEASLEKFGLREDADRQVDVYSKGMRQKLGLAQTLLHEPSVLFLDEPTSGLDPQAMQTVRNILRDLVADGTAVFLSTHILPVVDQLADRVGVLYRGTLVAETSPMDLKADVKSTTDPTLEEAFIELTTRSTRSETE